MKIKITHLTIKEQKAWALYLWAKKNNDYHIHSKIINCFFKHVKILNDLYILRPDTYTHGVCKELVFDRQYYNDFLYNAMNARCKSKIGRYLNKISGLC